MVCPNYWHHSIAHCNKHETFTPCWISVVNGGITSTLIALKYFSINQLNQSDYFQFEIIINVSVTSFCFIRIPMLLVYYGQYNLFYYSFSAGIDFRHQASKVVKLKLFQYIILLEGVGGCQLHHVFTARICTINLKTIFLGSVCTHESLASIWLILLRLWARFYWGFKCVRISIIAFDFDFE